MTQNVNVFQRFFLAFVAFFAVLFRRNFAVAVKQFRQTGALPAAPETAQLPAKAVAPAAAADGESRGALHLLAILQREGRLIDFLQEDVAGATDDQIGAAARIVHEGCRKALQSYIALEPIYGDPEGARIEVPNGFDPASVRLTGNVVGNPPFRGSLKHHGWRAREVKLPSHAEQDPAIVAPAEVEL